MEDPFEGDSFYFEVDTELRFINMTNESITTS